MVTEIKIFTKTHFEELFKEYFTPLTYFAQKFIHDHDASKEIVHDVFINLWNKRDTIDPDKQIKSYLFTSVNNRCLNYIRDNKKFDQNVVELERFSEESYDSSDKLVEAETEDRIFRAINELPEKCKEIFMLSRFEQLKYGEIAEKLNISVKTVEAQMSKALRHLRDRLSDLVTILVFILIEIF